MLPEVILLNVLVADLAFYLDNVSVVVADVLLLDSAGVHVTLASIPPIISGVT